MMLIKRDYCVDYSNRVRECYREGFWYTDKGIIIKWCILGGIFLFFMAWFVGGYIHAKRRMKKGLPLMSYHRWLVPNSVRRQHGHVPQNHFTFYATQQQPYGHPQYQQRADGTYPEPPPMYNGDAPPGYYAPPGATKVNPNQGGMEMPQYGQPQYGQSQYGQYPMPPQQNGFVGASASDAEQGQSGANAQLPERPETARTKITNIVSRFRR